MSTSLIVLIPVVLLAIIPLLCFVGCVFAPNKGVTDFGQYEDAILNTPNLVAFWPLDDTSGTTAVDLGSNNFSGTYTQGPNVSYDPVNKSAAAPGTVSINQPGIVPGDQLNNNQNPCAVFDGGFVTVPFQAALNPQPPFTIEAWVVANWTASDVQNFPAARAVVASANGPMNTGFGLLATSDNYWEAFVGTGSGFVNVRPPVGSNQPIMLNSLYFLVVTYDGTTLTLWVDPADTSAGPYAQATVSGFAPVASSTPLFIGMGRPDLPDGLFPFNGSIQDVAFYNVVLDNSTIETHYMKGNAIQMT